jgi:hypothetical protein
MQVDTVFYPNNAEPVRGCGIPIGNGISRRPMRYELNVTNEWGARKRVHDSLNLSDDT